MEPKIIRLPSNDIGFFLESVDLSSGRSRFIALYARVEMINPASTSGLVMPMAAALVVMLCIGAAAVASSPGWITFFPLRRIQHADSPLHLAGLRRVASRRSTPRLPPGAATHRWTPSAYNVQPWRFIYARAGTAAWAPLLATLNPSKQSWAQRASALLIIILANNATPGAGIDKALAKASLGVPDDHTVQIAVAIGRRSEDKSLLPKSLQSREAPSTRLSLTAIASEGRFGQRHG